VPQNISEFTVSGDFPTPSRQREETAACRDQAGQPCTGDRTGNSDKTIRACPKENVALVICRQGCDPESRGEGLGPDNVGDNEFRWNTLMAYRREGVTE